MGRSSVQQVLNTLASSSNDFASGIALCIKALAETSASPPASPIIIEYRGRRMAFGRRNLERMDGHVRFVYSSLVSFLSFDIVIPVRKQSGWQFALYTHKAIYQTLCASLQRLVYLLKTDDPIDV
jgi:hypothetical protein